MSCQGTPRTVWHEGEREPLREKEIIASKSERLRAEKRPWHMLRPGPYRCHTQEPEGQMKEKRYAK